jgi:hypothetical protein
MSNIAVIPVVSEPLVRTRIAGRTPVEHLLRKLSEIRDLHIVAFVGPYELVVPLRAPDPLRWQNIPLKEPYRGPTLSLRQQFRAEGHLQDNYLFCNPFYPLLGAGRMEQALIAVLGGYRGAVTVGMSHGAFARQNGSGLSRFTPVGLDACVALCGSVPVQREDLWFCGDKVEYIPITDIEAVNVLTEEGLKLAQALVLTGDV